MFDALEARMNRVAMAKLANALAIIPGQSDPVPVIFDAEYRAGSVGVIGMGAADPQMVIASDKLPAEIVGLEVIVNGVTWFVSDRQPDGVLVDGLTAVILGRP